jgi:MFS family permease
MRRYYARVVFEHFSIGLIMPVMVVWKLQNGLSITQVGITEALVLVTTMLAEVPAGHFADKHSNRLSLIVGSILMFVSFAMLAVGGSMPLFMAAAICVGGGWAFISGSDEAHIHDDYGAITPYLFKKRLSTAVIFDESATLLGLLMAIILLGANGQLRLLFVFAALGAAVTVIYSSLFLPSPPKSTVDFARHPLAVPHFDFGLVRGKLVTFLLLGLLYENLRFVWQPILVGAQIELGKLGVIYAALQVASIVGGIMAAKIKYSPVVFGLSIAAMIASLGGIVSTYKSLVIFSLIGLQVAENVFRVLQSTYINTMVTRNRATFLSMASFARNAMGAAAIYGVGLFGGSHLRMGIAVFVIVKILVLAFLVRTTQTQIRSASKRV